MSDRIEKTIDLKAPIERVWRAISNHEEFGNWFRVKIDEPFVAGTPAIGKITYPGYEHVTWRVIVKEMKAPHLFSFTWHPYAIDPDTDYSDETPTLVEFRLTSIPEGTRLTIIESGFDGVPAKRREEAMRMNDGGWSMQVENIRTHVEA